MQLLEVLDANLAPLAINVDRILFVGPGTNGGVTIVLDMPTAAGPLGLGVSGTHAQIVAKLKAVQEQTIQIGGPHNHQ